MRLLVPLLLLTTGCDILFQLREVETQTATGRPKVVGSIAQNCPVACNTLSVPFTTVDRAPTTLLLVTVSTSNFNGAAPITGVRYGDASLTLNKRGTAGSSGSNAALENWTLLDPPVGPGTVTVTLGDINSSLVVGVTQIEGVSSVAPVRAAVPAGSSVEGFSADNVVDSAANDLVIDTVCAGGSVDTPGEGQTILYVQNVTALYQCDNLGASSTNGRDEGVAVHWEVNGDKADHWIGLATSFAPAD